MELLILAMLFCILALFFNAVGIISIYEKWKVGCLSITYVLFTFMFFMASVISGAIGVGLLTKVTS